MTALTFVKMHGIGNDYVYVDAFAQRVDDPESLAPRIADRHRGVGGDGLILVMPPEKGVAADVRMRMFNADGSESEMCGNGVRCVCKLAFERGLSRARPMRVQTGRGVLSLDYSLDGRGHVSEVTVDMGEPILDPGLIPVDLHGAKNAEAPVVLHDLSSLLGGDWPGIDLRVTCVSMGNPHAVFFCDDVDGVPLESIGPKVERLGIFPRRTNAHFVECLGGGTERAREVKMRTWERGAGATLACGTGASAVCVAGVLAERTAREILAHLPGGDLRLRWDEASGHVFMTGPAEEAFTGVWPG